MNAIEQIRQKLQTYPLLRCREIGNKITVAPTSTRGFSVSLTVTGVAFIVSFDGWHEHFKSQEDALNCFVFGLSDQCRLKVFRRGKTDYRWSLEYRTEGGWNEESTTGFVFFPFWQKREIIFRQNGFMEEGCISRS